MTFSVRSLTATLAKTCDPPRAPQRKEATTESCSVLKRGVSVTAARACPCSSIKRRSPVRNQTCRTCEDSRRRPHSPEAHCPVVQQRLDPSEPGELHLSEVARPSESWLSAGIRYRVLHQTALRRLTVASVDGAGQCWTMLATSSRPVLTS